MSIPDLCPVEVGKYHSYNITIRESDYMELNQEQKV